MQLASLIKLKLQPKSSAKVKRLKSGFSALIPKKVTTKSLQAEAYMVNPPFNLSESPYANIFLLTDF